jgi:hypothetical protein
MLQSGTAGGFGGGQTCGEGCTEGRRAKQRPTQPEQPLPGCLVRRPALCRLRLPGQLHHGERTAGPHAMQSLPITLQHPHTPRHALAANHPATSTRSARPDG